VLLIGNSQRGVVTLERHILWLAIGVAAIGAFFGHLYPIWLSFKGGKGVATFLGCLLGAAWPGAVVFAAVWMLVAFFTRYSSAAALIASVVAPAALFAVFGRPQAGAVFLGLAAVMWLRHRANIVRLLNGTEPKIGAKG